MEKQIPLLEVKDLEVSINTNQILKNLNIKYVFTPHKLISDIQLEEKNDIIKCSLKEYEGTMFFACIYFDKKK